MTQATAALKSYGAMEGGKRVRTLPISPEMLVQLLTPEPTRTWQPVPHSEVVEQIRSMINLNNWRFIDPEQPFSLLVTETYTKLFGVTKIIIPGYSDLDSEIQLAIGFRNSHDKTLALRIAVGTHVSVCSNLVMSGDFQVARDHTKNISVRVTLEKAFAMIPQAAKRLITWTGNLRAKPIGQDTGIALLAEAVEKKALALGDFMGAREAFLSAYQGQNEEIRYGTTYWALYQAISAQYKNHSLHVNQTYSTALNALFQKKVGDS